jgi:hypothetical protein
MARNRKETAVRVDVAAGIKAQGSAYTNQGKEGVYDAENVSFLADKTVAPFPTLSHPGDGHDYIYDTQYDYRNDTRLDSDTQGAATLTSVCSDGRTVYATSGTGADYERVLIRRSTVGSGGWWENTDAPAPFMVSTHGRASFVNYGSVGAPEGVTIAATPNSGEYVVVSGLSRAVFRDGEPVVEPGVMEANNFPYALADARAVGGSSGYVIGTKSSSGNKMLLTQHSGGSAYHWELTLTGTKGVGGASYQNNACVWDAWMTGETLYVLYTTTNAQTVYLDQFTGITSLGGSTTSTPTAKSVNASRTWTKGASDDVYGVAISRTSTANAVECAYVYNDATNNKCHYFVTTSDFGAALTTDIDDTSISATVASRGVFFNCTVAGGMVLCNATTQYASGDTMEEVLEDTAVAALKVSGGAIALHGYIFNTFLASHLTANATVALGYASSTNPLICLFTIDDDYDYAGAAMYIPRNRGMLVRNQLAGYVNDPAKTNGGGLKWMANGLMSSIPDLINTTSSSSKAPTFMYPLVMSSPQEAFIDYSATQFKLVMELRKTEQVCVQASLTAAGAVLNNGYMFTDHFDTTPCVSLTPPEISLAEGGAGVLAAGDYSVRVLALVEQGGFESYVASSTSTVTITASKLITLTVRFSNALADVKRLLVYRTTVDPAANTQDFYLESIHDLTQYVASPAYGARTISISLNTADATIDDNAIDPTLGGFAAPVEMPEGVFAVCEAGNRIWFANETFLIPCMPRTGRQLPQPLAAYAVRLPANYGRITALAELNGSPIVFTEKAVYGISGNGPDYTGAGSSLEPYLIHTGSGAIGPSAVVTCPAGVVFADVGGIYLLDSGRSVQRIGGDIQRFFTNVNESTTTASRLNVAMDVNFVRNEVYIQWDSYMFIFNYLVGAWSRCTTVGHPAVVKFGPNVGEMQFGTYATTATYTYTSEANFTTNVLTFPDPSTICHIRRVYVDGEFASAAVVTGSDYFQLVMYNRAGSTIETLGQDAVTAREFRLANPRQNAVKFKLRWKPNASGSILTDFVIFVDADTVDANKTLE